MSKQKNNFHSVRTSFADTELLCAMENRFEELCARIAECTNMAEKNSLRISRIALGQRIVRAMLTNGRTMYIERRGSRTLTMLSKGAKLDGELLTGMDIQGAIADGRIGNPSESMLYMIKLADRAGFSFYQFYSNLVEDMAGDEYEIAPILRDF